MAAGNAVVGALRVDLGLNSAQFESGLKQAQKGLGRFGVQLTLSLETIAEGVGRLIGAFPRAVKGAIDHADALSKTAQKAGVTVEALSRLEYAAKLSDVELEGLATGLRKLSQNMLATASGAKGPAATAFKALGISVVDSQGKLRSTDAVLADLADRFGRMPDGAQKTAIAMNLLGKSGAELIPLLNSGKQGLADMANEADRLGQTISTKTARDAETFNDTITRIQATFGGLVNKITAAVLPALQSIADTISSPEFQSAIVGVATLVTNLLDGILKFAEGAKRALDFILNYKPRQTAIEKLKPRLSKMAEPGQSYGQFYEKRLAEIYGPLGGNNINLLSPIPGLPKPGGTDKPLLPPIINEGAVKAAEDAAKAYRKVIDAAKERIAQSQIEAQALGMTEEAANRLRFTNELLTQATADGAKVSAAQRIELGSLAASMAAAAERTRQLTEIYDLGKSTFGEFFSNLKSDLMNGVSLWGSFADAASKALNRIADKALSMAADGIFDMIFNAISGSLTGGIGGGGGGLFGGAGKAVHLGRFATGGSGLVPRIGAGTDSILAVAQVSPGEPYAFGKDATRGGGATLNVTIDARNAQVGVAEQIEQVIRFRLPGLVNRIIADPHAVGAA